MAAAEGDAPWGILGGTFDPVHTGHLTLANDLSRRRKLRGVLFVPTFRHPFKQDFCTASYEHRARMLALAIESYASFELCEIEAESNLPGDTLTTIRALKQRFPERDFRFIIGADNIEQISIWHEPQELLREVRMLVGARPGYELRLIGDLPADRFELAETEPVDISSSQLRQWLRERSNRDRVAESVPPAVLAYIEKENLYR